MVYPNDDKQVINLQHVLPEQVENNWPEFDEDTARIYVRRIGNLALLLAKNNSDLRSSDFNTKRAAYKNGPYELTRMISNSLWCKSGFTERKRIRNSQESFVDFTHGDGHAHA